jgi:hypothetical protein
MGVLTRGTGPGAFTIGPVSLDVPPEAIQISRYENQQFIQFLRHEHSVKIPSGRTAVRVDISFRLMMGEEFSDLETLQMLIAMTRVTPFVPVINKYLSHHLPLFIEGSDLTDTSVDSIPMAIFGMSLVAGGDSPELVEVSMSLLFWNPMPFTGGEAMAWRNSGIDAIQQTCLDWIKQNIGNVSPVPIEANTFNLRWYDMRTYSELLELYPSVRESSAETNKNDVDIPLPPADYIPELENELRRIAREARVVAKAEGIPSSEDADLRKPGSTFDTRMAQWQAKIEAAAAKYGINPDVYKRLINQESRGNPSAGSNKGALGLAQLMPITAKNIGVTDRLDPDQSINGGAKLLREELDRFQGNYRLAVAAYNAGSPAVKNAGNQVPKFKETQDYVNIILGYTIQDPALLRNVAHEDIVETAIKDYYKSKSEPLRGKEAIENFWRKGVLPQDPDLRTDLMRRFGIDPRTKKRADAYQDGPIPLTAYGKVIAKIPVKFVDPEIVRKLGEIGWFRTSDDIRPIDPLFQLEDKPRFIRLTPEGKLRSETDQIVTGLSMSFQNRLVLIPVTGWIYPTIQHMGAFDSDIRVSMALLANNEEYPTFKKINQMAHEIDGRSLRYRSSVYSGRDVFAITKINVENRILNGLGIDHVVLTDFQAIRDPESPELIRVELGLTQNGMVDEELFGHFTYSDILWRRSLFTWLIEKSWLNPTNADGYTTGVSAEGLLPWTNKIFNLWATQEEAYLKNKNDLEFAQGQGKTAPNNRLSKSITDSIEKKTSHKDIRVVQDESFFGKLFGKFDVTNTAIADNEFGVTYKFVPMPIGPPAVAEAGLMERWMNSIDDNYTKTPVVFPVPTEADYLVGGNLLNAAGDAFKFLFGSVLTADQEYPSRLATRYLSGPYATQITAAIELLKTTPTSRPNAKIDTYETNPAYINATFNWLSVWNDAHREWYKTEVIEVMLINLARQFPEYFAKLTNDITAAADRKTGCYRDLGLANQIDTNPYQWVDSDFAPQVKESLQALHETSMALISGVMKWNEKDLVRIADGTEGTSTWNQVISKQKHDNKDLEITPKKALDRYNQGVKNSRATMGVQIEDALASVKDISPVQFTVRRAFPAFKLYFVEEENGGIIKTFDQFYSYNAILDWNIIEQVNRGSTLVVTVSNIFNHLDAIVINDTIDMAGQAKIAVDGMRGGQQALSHNKGAGRVLSERGTDGRTNSLSNIALKPGTKIVLKVGYNNDPRKLETLFAGQVTEVMAGDTMTIVAQGWESELTATWSADVESPFAGLAWRQWISDKEEELGHGGTSQVMTAILHHYNCKHLGHWQIGQANPFDLYTWSFTENKVQKDAKAIDGVVAGDRSMTNVRPTSMPFYSVWGLNAEIADIELKGRTLWDIANELRLRHPNNILMVRPYGNGDGTVYFGPGWGTYTATDFVDGEGLFDRHGFEEYRWRAFQTIIDQDKKILLNRVSHKPGSPQLEGLEDIWPWDKLKIWAEAKLGHDIGQTLQPIEIRYLLQDPRIMRYLFLHSNRSAEFTLRWNAIVSSKSAQKANPTAQSQNVSIEVRAAQKRNRQLTDGAWIDLQQVTEVLYPNCPEYNKKLFFDALESARYVGIQSASDKEKWNQIDIRNTSLSEQVLTTVRKMIDQEIIRTLLELKEKAEKDPTNPKNAEIIKSLRFLSLVVKPVRKWHIVTSKNHIIANNIELSSDFNTSVKFGDLYVSFDPGLDEVRTRDYTNVYKSGRSVDGFVASSLLANEMRKMYQGEIIITGNPEIRPHDIVLILDHTRQIYGIVEAETVVNSMSIEYGYITTIKPSLIVEVADSTIAHAYQALYSALANDFITLDEKGGEFGKKIAGALAFAYTGRTYGDMQEFQAEVNKITNGSIEGGPDSKTHGLANVSMGVGGIAAAGGAAYLTSSAIGAVASLGEGALLTTVAATGGTALIPIAIVLGVTGAALLIGGYAYASFLQNSLLDQVRLHPLSITPLVKRGLPFVGGIDGAVGRTVVGQWGRTTLKGWQDMAKARDVVAEAYQLGANFQEGRADVSNAKANKPTPIK